MSSSYAFVVPRFGPQIGGGAESLVRQLAIKLAQRGDFVHVFTTCALDNRTWKNELPTGIEQDHKVVVHRFEVDQSDHDIWVPLQIGISHGMRLKIDAQLDWMEHSVNSKKLYTHIAQVADEYRAIFFAPYLFGTTFWGSLVRPDKSILIPCLHDESYAYQDVIATMFKKVRGALFNTQAEKLLAEKIYGPIKGAEVGMGFECANFDLTAETNPSKLNQNSYLLYLGRKETGKSGDLLIDNFLEAKEKFPQLADLKLVFCGSGSFNDLCRPEAIDHPDILDLAYVSESQKQLLIKDALALCQPSTNESFSIVLMEAWQQTTPVIVNKNCAVTYQHVIDSGGGLYFESAFDLGMVLCELMQNSELRQNLGNAGLEYVKQKYNWQAVLERFDAAVEGVLG